MKQKNLLYPINRLFIATLTVIDWVDFKNFTLAAQTVAFALVDALADVYIVFGLNYLRKTIFGGKFLF